MASFSQSNTPLLNKPKATTALHHRSLAETFTSGDGPDISTHITALPPYPPPPSPTPPVQTTVGFLRPTAASGVVVGGCLEWRELSGLESWFTIQHSGILTITRCTAATCRYISVPLAHQTLGDERGGGNREQNRTKTSI